MAGYKEPGEPVSDPGKPGDPSWAPPKSGPGISEISERARPAAPRFLPGFPGPPINARGRPGTFRARPPIHGLGIPQDLWAGPTGSSELPFRISGPTRQSLARPRCRPQKFPGRDWVPGTISLRFPHCTRFTASVSRVFQNPALSWGGSLFVTPFRRPIQNGRGLRPRYLYTDKCAVFRANRTTSPLRPGESCVTTCVLLLLRPSLSSAVKSRDVYPGTVSHILEIYQLSVLNGKMAARGRVWIPSEFWTPPSTNLPFESIRKSDGAR